jgi:hypothetical protein
MTFLHQLVYVKLRLVVNLLIVFTGVMEFLGSAETQDAFDVGLIKKVVETLADEFKKWRAVLRLLRLDLTGVAVKLGKKLLDFFLTDHHYLELLVQQMDHELSEINAKTPLARAYDLKSRMHSLTQFLEYQLLSDESKRLLVVHLLLNQIQLERKNSERTFDSWHRLSSAWHRASVLRATSLKVRSAKKFDAPRKPLTFTPNRVLEERNRIKPCYDRFSPQEENDRGSSQYIAQWTRLKDKLEATDAPFGLLRQRLHPEGVLYFLQQSAEKAPAKEYVEAALRCQNYDEAFKGLWQLCEAKETRQFRQSLQILAHKMIIAHKTREFLNRVQEADKVADVGLLLAAGPPSFLLLGASLFRRDNNYSKMGYCLFRYVRYFKRRLSDPAASSKPSKGQVAKAYSSAILLLSLMKTHPDISVRNEDGQQLTLQEVLNEKLELQVKAIQRTTTEKLDLEQVALLSGIVPMSEDLQSRCEDVIKDFRFSQLRQMPMTVTSRIHAHQLGTFLYRALRKSKDAVMPPIWFFRQRMRLNPTEAAHEFCDLPAPAQELIFQELPIEEFLPESSGPSDSPKLRMMRTHAPERRELTMKFVKKRYFTLKENNELEVELANRMYFGVCKDKERECIVVENGVAIIRAWVEDVWVQEDLPLHAICVVEAGVPFFVVPQGDVGYVKFRVVLWNRQALPRLLDPTHGLQLNLQQWRPWKWTRSPVFSSHT